MVRPKSKQKLRASLKRFTKRNNSVCMEAIIGKINPILRGWYGYFKHAHKNELKRMDGWTRMRLRSILRNRQGRKGRGRGLDHHRWRNDYFATLGLFSLEAAKAEEISLRNGVKR